MENTEQLARLQRLQETLATSKTAQSGEQMPTMQDINTQKAVLKTEDAIRASQDKALKESWYGANVDDKKEASVSSPGLLNKTINASLTPLYGVVGAIDYATGRSTGSNVIDAINQNMTTNKRTMGDVLRPALGNKAGSVAGFVSDIFLDPINLVTAGTAALIPRMAVGLTKGAAKSGVKGAVKGLGYAAESRLLETALTARAITLGGTRAVNNIAVRLNPMQLMKNAPKVADKAKMVDYKTSSFVKKIEERSINANKQYDEILGKDAVTRAIEDAGAISYPRMAFNTLAEKALDSSPVVREYFDKYFKYSNTEWTRISEIKDALLRTAGAETEIGIKAFVKAYDSGMDFDKALQAAQQEIAPIIEKRLAEAGADTIVQNTLFEVGAEAEKLSKAEFDKVIQGFVKNAAEGGEEALSTAPEKLQNFAKFMEDATATNRIIENPAIYVSADPLENGLRLAAEQNLIDLSKTSDVIEDLRKIIERDELGQSGVQWWDDFRHQLKVYRDAVNESKKTGGPVDLKNKVGAKTAAFFDLYEALMAVFKRGAVAANPAAWTNSIAGNPIMAFMTGFDIFDPKWLRGIKEADTIIGGRKGAELLLNEMAQIEDVLPMMRQNPSLFESTVGLKPHQIERVAQAKNLVARFKATGVDAGILLPDTKNADVVAMMEDVIRETAKIANVGEEGMAAFTEAFQTYATKELKKTPSARKLALVDDAGEVSGTPATDMITTEFFDSPMANKFFKHISDKAQQPGAYGAKIADVLFNKMPDAYGGIDYRFKLGTILYATKYGVKEGELRKLVRFTQISPEEITPVFVNGVQRFKLSSSVAFSLANETYLNYNAMPAIVKLLRHLPLVGAPFASFMYGMYAKTMKTALNNPAVFNKVNLAINEASGEKTPIERALLTMGRYDYLNDPAMLKLPTPGNSMVFMNMANMLPYYSLNLFQPASRSYEEVLPNAIVNTLDKVPLLQDPTGATLFNFLVLPMLLQDELPQGTFGQPLFPSDATAIEKAGYLARTLVEPYVPSAAQIPLGLATGFTAPGITQYMPGYRWRQIAEAVQGNTSIGASSKEAASQRTGRALLGSFGIPVQTPVPYEYLDEEEFMRNSSSNN